MTLPVGALMSWHLACCQGDMSNTPKLRNSQMQPPADAGELTLRRTPSAQSLCLFGRAPTRPVTNKRTTERSRRNEDFS